MRVVRLLSLRRLRLQPTRAVLAAVVVGAGVSLVVAIVVIMSSLSTSVQTAGRALSGPAPLRIVGPIGRGGVTPRTLDAISSTPGVAAAVPLVQGITLVDRGRGGDEVPVTLLGFDCRIEALYGSFGCNPAVQSALTGPVESRRLASELGTGANVRTNLGRVPLDPRAAVAAIDAVNGGRVVAFPLAEAQRQLGRGDGFDVVYVVPAKGVPMATLQHRLIERLGPDVAVLSATDAPPVIGIVLATFIPLFTIIALLTLGIGAVLVRNSITLSLEERRRQTAIVAALGGNRRVLVWGSLIEVGMLGLVGGVLGAAGGYVVAIPVSAGLEGFTRAAAGIPINVQLRPPAIVVALVVGIGVSLLAAVGPARRSVRLDVAAELAGRGRREDIAKAGTWPRIGLAALGSAAGVLLCVRAQAGGGIERWQSTLAPIAFLVTVVPTVYLVASLVPRLLRAVEDRVTFRRAPARLALANLRREPRRTGVLAIALGFAMGVGFVTASFRASVTAAITDSLSQHSSAVEVASQDPGNAVLNEARLDATVLARLAALPGVLRVDRSQFALLGNHAGKLTGIEAYTDPWLNYAIATGQVTRAALDAGEVTVGPALARSDHLRPGDKVRLTTPAGEVSLPVMAVVYDGNFGGRNVLMSYQLMTQLYGTQAPVVVEVQPKPGVDGHTLATTIREAHLDPALVVNTSDQVLARNIKQVSQQLSSFDALQRGLLAMSFIAVLSTLLLVGVQRQREFGMLAAVGMTPKELRRMVLAEAGIIALAAVVVGSLGSALQYLALNLITPVIIGYRDPFRLALGSLAAYAAVAILVALVAALYPGRRAGRVEVLTALRYE